MFTKLLRTSLIIGGVSCYITNAVATDSDQIFEQLTHLKGRLTQLQTTQCEYGDLLSGTCKMHLVTWEHRKMGGVFEHLQLHDSVRDEIAAIQVQIRQLEPIPRQEGSLHGPVLSPMAFG